MHGIWHVFGLLLQQWKLLQSYRYMIGINGITIKLVHWITSCLVLTLKRALYYSGTGTVIMGSNLSDTLTLT